MKTSTSQRAARNTRSRKNGDGGQMLEGMKIVDGTSLKVVTSTNATQLFNPASNTKLATTLAVVQKFGFDYRMQTRVLRNGTINAHGELEGDLFVSGCYMLFGDRQAHELAQLLVRHGITSVSGDLYVSPLFCMNLHLDGEDAGKKLLSILDPVHGRAPAVRHKTRLRRRKGSAAAVSSISIAGTVKVAHPAEHAILIATHNAPPVKDVIKIMLCYSDNTMAEKFGVMVGGPSALEKFVIDKVGVPAAEVHFETTSGLNSNRISPRAMMQILVALRDTLAAAQLNLSDLLAVAGVDLGTMKGRLNSSGQAGSVIAKTGTLTETDQGVSTLSGEISTTSGTYLFVIFEMHGDVLGFRHRQDQLVSQFQVDHGGAQPIAYVPILPR
ncbi:MAG TPA: D-alanyl-D-alanine carboxypeptidase, partial [Chroococcales cyanobacterium]